MMVIAELNVMNQACKTHKMFIRAAEMGLHRNTAPADTLQALKAKYQELAKQVMCNEYGNRWDHMVEFNSDQAEEFLELQNIANQYAEQKFYSPPIACIA
jgi:transaldolase